MNALDKSMLTRYKDKLQNVPLTIIPPINPIVIYHQVIFHTSCS